MPEKIKILIAEDRKVDRRFLRKMLEGGYEVQEAADGQEGLEMARLHKPDLIISDAMMPVMDGFRFLRNVKKDKDLKNIPFIFYSAVYTGRMDEKLALSLGARAFIEKPAPPDEFMEKLKAVIQQIEAGEEPAPVELIEEEEEYLRNYSDVVAAKLEEKVEELEKHREHLEELVKERTAELEEKNAELERVNKLFVGRELRMKELKQEIKRLKGI